MDGASRTELHFPCCKMAAMRGWEVSKLDVKGAFLNAPLPDGELILVEPPKQWKDWGIVGQHVVWRLQKAVYGLRLYIRSDFVF